MEILANNSFIADPVIEPVSNGEYEYSASISSDCDVLFNNPESAFSHLVAVKRADKLLRFMLVDAEPVECIVRGSCIIYPDAFTDVDIYYNVSSGELKEDIVLISDMAPKSFAFALESEGVAASLQEDGSISYLDSISGEHVWTVNAPYAVDANGVDVPVNMVFGEGVYSLEVVTTAETEYPVRLDPTVTINVTESLYTLSSLKTTGTKYGTYTLALAPYEASISALTSIKLRIYSSFGAAYGGLSYIEWRDKDGIAIAPQVTNYVSETYIDVPINACYAVFQLWSVRYNTLNANDVTIYLYGYGIDTDKTLSFKRLNFTKSPTVTNPALNASFQISVPGSASPTNVGMKSFFALPGCTFASGSLQYSCNKSTDYGATWSADIKYYDSGNNQLGSAITVALPAYTLAYRTITVPDGAVRMDFSYSVKSASSNGFYLNFYFDGVIGNQGTFGARECFYVVPGYSGDYSVSIATNAAPTVPMRTYYSASSSGPWVEETVHTFTANTPVYLATFLGDTNQTAVTIWQSYFIYKQAAALIEDIADFDMIRPIIVSSSATTDTLRKLLALEESDFDTTRLIARTVDFGIDTVRRCTVYPEGYYDARRLIKVSSSIEADTYRKLVAIDMTTIDTVRRLLKEIQTQVNTERRLTVSESSLYDTSRVMEVFLIAVETMCDLKRRVAVHYNIHADTDRRIVITESASIDTSRMQLVLDSDSFDTIRVLKALLHETSGSYDLSRRIVIGEEPLYDTLRRAYSLIGGGTVELSAHFMADLMGVLRLKR